MHNPITRLLVLVTKYRVLQVITYVRCFDMTGSAVCLHQLHHQHKSGKFCFHVAMVMMSLVIDVS